MSPTSWPLLRFSGRVRKFGASLVCVFDFTSSFVCDALHARMVCHAACPMFSVCTFICDPLSSVCGAYHPTSLFFVCRISSPHARCISLPHHHQVFTPSLYPAFPRILRIHHVYCCPAHIPPCPRPAHIPPPPRAYPPRPPPRAYPPRPL